VTAARGACRRQPISDPWPIGAEIKRTERFLSLAGTLVGVERAAADAEQRAAQLARIRASKSDKGVVNLQDMGPAIRFEHGSTEPDERVDADKLAITGARATDPIATMLARKHIDRDQWQAANKLRDDVEMSAGRFTASAFDRVSSGSRSARWPTDNTIDALARVRAVIRDLAPELLEVCEAVILRRQPICRFATMIGRRRQAASALVGEALDALALHYGLARRRS